MTFSFEAEPVERTAHLGLLFGSVAQGFPNAIGIDVDGAGIESLIDVMGASDGPEWDSLTHELTIPAGSTHVTVQAFSIDMGTGAFAGNDPASMTWVFASLSLSALGGDGDEGCSGRFWRRNGDRWDGRGDDVTSSIRRRTHFNRVMGVHWWRSGLWNWATLQDALRFRGRGFGGSRILNYHAAAALANADAGLDYPYTVYDVVQLYRDAVNADWGPETVHSAMVKLRAANRLDCPLD